MDKLNLKYPASKIDELLTKIDSQNFNNYLLNTGGILKGRYYLGLNAEISNNSGGRILGHDGLSTTIIGNAGGILNLEAVGLNVRVSNGLSSYRVLTEADKGINIVPLDSYGKISSQYLPSSVDDIVEVTSTNDLKTITGERGKIYVTLDTNITYRWSGTQFVEISKSLGLGTNENEAYPGNLGAANARNIVSLTSTVGTHSSDINALKSTVGSHTNSLSSITSTLQSVNQSIINQGTTIGEHTQQIANLDSNKLGKTEKAADSAKADSATTATTASRLGGSMFEYRSFTKNDNSGWPMLLLLSECSDLYNGNASATKQCGFIGIANSSRSEGLVTQDNIVLLTARHGYSSTSASGRALYTSNSYLAPKVVKYNDKYYVALIVSGSCRTIALVGKFYNALGDFIKLNFKSASALPTGVEIIQEGSDYFRVNALSATKLATARTLWGQSFDGTGNIEGDILLLNKDSNDGNVNSALIEFSGGYRYYGPYIKAESSPTYGGYGRKDLKFYQRKATVWPTDYSNHFVAMIINAIGNVGIGTTSPSEKLEVAGNIKARGNVTAINGDFSGTLSVGGNATINGTMTATATYHSSDERLKTFEGDVEVDLEKLKALPKKYFYWKSDADGKRQLGTSAQAVEKIFPELVSTDANNDSKSVNYANLSIVALAAIDKLAEQNDKLAEQNAELVEQNADLKRRVAKIEKLLNIE